MKGYTDKGIHQTIQGRGSKPTALTSATFSASTTESLRLWSDRGLEVLWLLIVVLVPLVAVSRDYLISATVTPEAALVKIATLRTLVALMIILWAFEWSLRTRLHFSNPFNQRSLLLQPSKLMSGWMSGLKAWFPGTSSSWLLIAVIFSTFSLALSSALSASPDVSLWGSVPGQDGYAAYTLFSYVLFFGVIATHLKTKDQLWRLVSVVVLMGVLFSGFAVFQHYSHDPLQLMEHADSARVTSTAGNPIFAGSLLLMTIGLSLVLAGVHLKESLRERRFWLKLSLWAPVIAIQGLRLLFTLSRGPWVGTILALLVFLTMATIFMGWRTLARFVAVIAATAALMAAAVLSPAWIPNGEEGASLPAAERDTGQVVADRFATISGPPDGSLRARFEIWEASYRLWHDPNWFEFQDLRLSWMRPLIGYGPDLYRYTYFLESFPRGGNLLVYEAQHAHNFYMHQLVEQGLLGVGASLGIFGVVILGGSYLLLRGGREYPKAYTLLLIGLIAITAGRALEQIVGLARASDLTIFWALLATFLVLPKIARSEASTETDIGSKPPPDMMPSLRRRRNGLSRHGRRNYSWPRIGIWLVVVLSVATAVGLLTWFKTINYPLAAREMALGRDNMSQGDIQAGVRKFERAIGRAPDVPTYYPFLANVYSAYADNIHNDLNQS